MSKSELIKFSGWAFIAASVFFLSLYGSSDAIQFTGSVISALLLAAGMLGMRAAYSETIGPLGRSILLAGVIAMVLWYLGIASLATLGSSGALHLTEADGKRWWIVIFGGPAVVLLALTLFGLSNLPKRSAFRLTWLPVLAGICYPAVYSFLFVYLVSHAGVLPGSYWPAVKFTFFIQSAVLCLFGFILITDSQKELATA